MQRLAGWLCGVMALLAVPAVANVSRAVNDFDGDGRTDLAWYQHGVETGVSIGKWTLRLSAGGTWPSNGVQEVQFGFYGTLALPGDFDGDGRADLCVYDPPNARWYIHNSTGPDTNFVFGFQGSLPVTGDFDGDLRTDVGYFEPARGAWSLRYSTGGVRNVTLGTPGRVPVVGDFDNDGRDDIGTYFAQDGSWHLLRSTAGLQQKNHGFPNTYPITGDYDGDGQADLGVVDLQMHGGGAGSPFAYLLQTTGVQTSGQLTGWSIYQAGAHGQGDYDGDGRTDFLNLAPPSFGMTGYIRNLNDGADVALPPLTNYFHGSTLTGLSPVLDTLRGWRAPADNISALPVSGVIGIAKLANGKQLRIDFGDGRASAVKMKDSAGMATTAYLGVLGDAFDYHLSSAGTPATGPITMMTRVGRSYSFLPLFVDFSGSGFYVLGEKSVGTYRDSQGTQSVTVTRYQIALVLFGAL